MTIGHHNYAYDGLIPDIPLAVGDRFYAQDFFRDLQWLEDLTGRTVTDLLESMPVLVKGGGSVIGVPDSLNIKGGIGYHEVTIKKPNSYASLPPSVTTDQKIVRVVWPNQTNFAIPSAVLDGSTPNYVKVAYAEIASPTRARAKKAGSYIYQVTPSYLITVDDIAPTSGEILLATFTGVVGGPYDIVNANPHGDASGINFHKNKISNDAAHVARRFSMM